MEKSDNEQKTTLGEDINEFFEMLPDNRLIQELNRRGYYGKLKKSEYNKGYDLESITSINLKKPDANNTPGMYNKFLKEALENPLAIEEELQRREQLKNR